MSGEMKMTLRILILGYLSVSINALRILAVYPVPMQSHWNMHSLMLRELARRGHQVDVYTHFPQEQTIKNYKQVTLGQKINPNVSVDMANRLNAWKLMPYYTHLYGNHLCENLKGKAMKDLIQNTPRDTYDIVMVEMMFSKCYLAFGHHFDVPIVGTTTSVMLSWVNEAVGNVENPSYIPNVMMPYTEHMTFWQRFKNTLFSLYANFCVYLITLRQDEVVKEAFGPNVPSVTELERTVDLLLINSHHSLNGARPFTPGVVEVGGLHTEEVAGTLSPELSKWLDESTSGFVYFSMGSLVRSETFSPEVISSFYASFAKLAPIRVLWKANKADLPQGLPGNVLTMSWIPQRLVLKHKNVKAFITHGGLQSTLEAISAKIPLVGIPMVSDQLCNIKNYVNKKMAVAIDKYDITEQTLDAALSQILTDPTYRRNAEKVSDKFRDRPMSGLNTAMWWIEYVGRHGKGCLRTAVLDLSWWQAACWDVYGLLFAAIIIILSVLRVIVKSLIKQTVKYFRCSFYNLKGETKKSQ